MKISVITPSYNQSSFLEETIQSVISNTDIVLDYQIIDGGSSDDSINIIKKYERYLSYWISEKDKGQSEAINKGLSRISGDIVAYLNSDDCYTPDALKYVIEYFKLNPDVDVIVGKTQFINEHSTDIEGFKFTEVKEATDHTILDQCHIPQPSTFLKRRVFDSLGHFDQTLQYAFDYDFWVRAYINNFKFAFVDKTLSKFRLHNQSKTVKDYNDGKFELDFIKIYGKYLNANINKHRRIVISQAYLNQLALLYIHLEFKSINFKEKFNILQKLFAVPQFYFYKTSFRILIWLLISKKVRNAFKSIK